MMLVLNEIQPCVDVRKPAGLSTMHPIPTRLGAIIFSLEMESNFELTAYRLV